MSKTGQGASGPADAAPSHPGPASSFQAPDGPRARVPIPPDGPPAPVPPVPPPPPGPDLPEPPIKDPPGPGSPVPGDPDSPPPAGDPPVRMRPKEIGGPSGPEPTRYGDWERKGRVSDF